MRFKSVRAAVLLGMAAVFGGAGATEAQDVRTERVRFERGASSTVIRGSIQGYAGVDYVLGASAGQQMVVALETSNLSNYFNVIAPGASEAMHVGSIGGNNFAAILPSDADYRIRLYLMRNAARRNETAEYELSISVIDVGEDFADGLSGGPDFWEVTGLSAGSRLHVRTQPSTGSAIVARLEDGEVVRNMGCRMSDGERWCQVERPQGRARGWVAGRYLREAAAPMPVAATPGLPAGNGTPFDATGKVPCAVALGQPTRDCTFGVIRDIARQSAGVWIAIGGGAERYFLFEGGQPVFSNAPEEIRVERSGDLSLIRIGDERYEIPDAVLTGG